jgi:hypothetical protein
MKTPKPTPESLAKMQEGYTAIKFMADFVKGKFGPLAEYLMEKATEGGYKPFWIGRFGAPQKKCGDEKEALSVYFTRNGIPAVLTEYLGKDAQDANELRVIIEGLKIHDSEGDKLGYRT